MRLRELITAAGFSLTGSSGSGFPPKIRFIVCPRALRSPARRPFLMRRSVFVLNVLRALMSRAVAFYTFVIVRVEDSASALAGEDLFGIGQ